MKEIQAQSQQTDPVETVVEHQIELEIVEEEINTLEIQIEEVPAEDNSADDTIAGDLAADVDTAENEYSDIEAVDDDNNNTDVFDHNQMADRNIEALVSLAKDLSDNAEPSHDDENPAKKIRYVQSLLLKVFYNKNLKDCVFLSDIISPNRPKHLTW